MDPVVGSILISAAGRVGAPLIKSILERTLGGTAGEIGGAIVDVIAGRLGVAPDELSKQNADQIDQAVRDTEATAPDLVLQWAVKQQELSNQLQLAEMNKAGEPTWTWAWRPAWMWFLAFLFLFRLVAVPIVDAATGSDIAGKVDISALLTLTTWFIGLYMGGHTVKSGVEVVADIFRKRT